ncbi:peptide chain release factor aRF-1 [Methanothermococcus okinawensis]|uniref:Peptide chain release factor subunit 1 n=1 Tax=Methanothermococcus okinawensis (strain DSM 14208 / JCM 11175 / IH1) TaxID=647113 RepID=F8AML5_METOI|nr:peptide chain release factor aRF-1 [Methanothermococcus okinawensis]AEH06056.1 Peptide chain release factor subunit 1 [Methanothermococcus okinawensis IH1]
MSNSATDTYIFKKALKELKNKKGKGTELISLYIPAGKRLSDVGQYLREELSQSSNIKSKTTRKNVQSAIEVILQRLKLLKEPLEKGVIIFAGMIPRGGPGTEKMETYVLEPPEPVKTFVYRCDSQFYTEPLEDFIQEKDIYGIILIDRNEATLALVKGKNIQILKRLTSGVPGKFKAGGQSARRLERLIDDAANQFMVRVGEYANEAFLPLLQEKKLKGILVGGPGNTKNEFVNKDYLHHELKKIILETYDLCYTEEFGVRELLDKASGLLRDLDLMKEKEVVQKFFKELIKEDGGLAAYGEKEVMKYLEMGAVDTLIITDNINMSRVTIRCNNCDYMEEMNIKNEDIPKLEESLKTKTCPKCGGMLYIDKIEDIIEYFARLCDESGANLRIVSTDTEEGSQIYKAFKGIAAILRYRLD